MVTSPGIHLTSLSKIILRCISIPGKGGTRRPCWLGFLALESTHPGLPRMLTGPARALEPVYCGRLVRRPIVSGRVLLCGAKPQAPESHSPHPWCHVLLWPWQVLKAPECPAARMCEWHYHADRALKGLWHPVGTPFPLFNIRFLFARCHCFQRLRNVSTILKDQEEPPVN